MSYEPLKAESAQVHQQIAATRRLLTQPDLEIDDAKECAMRSLEACEILIESNDDLIRLLELIQARREAEAEVAGV